MARDARLADRPVLLIPLSIHLNVPCTIEPSQILKKWLDHLLNRLIELLLELFCHLGPPSHSFRMSRNNTQLQILFPLSRDSFPTTTAQHNLLLRTRVAGAMPRRQTQPSVRDARVSVLYILAHTV
ncbi:hypothetical protein HNY73_003666 [Argiope bruennichi]|uniref:Uncharacterized protein n=1 Tax=Argiope bruennichi TaxID=94029 RepID=A0A8T0FLD0_ARGBR|nr:hypothetical protein HNY73_003666 [Argiope bruennichi]